jgi:beta-N-acetylhexosaminidase
MSGLTIYFGPEETAVRALEAGADLLLKPTDADAALRGVRNAVQSGRLSEKRIEESARKILAAKYDLGLKDERTTPVDEIDRIVGNGDVNDLAQEIAEHTITLVRDEPKLLPLKNVKTKIFNLAITNGDDRFTVTAPFAGSLTRAGFQVETVVLDDRSTEVEIAKAIENAGQADVVLASLYGRVRSGEARSVGVPDAGRKALVALMEKRTPIIAISFGNPYLLVNFPGLRTYLVAYGDMPSLQQAAARAITGQIDITGRLPISLPGLYPRGTGIQLKKVS